MPPPDHRLRVLGLRSSRSQGFTGDCISPFMRQVEDRVSGIVRLIHMPVRMRGMEMMAATKPLLNWASLLLADPCAADW